MPMLVYARRVVYTTLAVGTSALAAAQSTSFRPPAVPLVACDPYFSIWSRANRLTDTDTTHWTGTRQRLMSEIVVDGKTYRLMGAGTDPALPQVGLQVTPTRSIYRFSGAGVGVTLTFLTPALPYDIDVLSRPVTYLTWDVKPTDGKSHTVTLSYTASGEPAVDRREQRVRWSQVTSGAANGLSGWRVGTVSQPVLQKTGDDRRIDWGYFYSVAPKPWVATRALAGDEGDSESTSVRTLRTSPQQVSSKGYSTHVILAYDDLFGIQYFTENLRPYWRRSGMDAEALLNRSETEYASLVKKCVAFDNELNADMKRIGGDRYAQLTALSYRQAWAGSKFVADKNGQPLFFPKENSSNGCIGTVDIIFPMAPQLLLFGPSLTKSLLVSNLDYASSEYWKWPFAPHDLGQYPKANGQVYGGGERTEENQMPVEESGNMLILTLALAQMEGNANFAAKYWPTLTRWAEYLRKEGFDPANQLSTDDFMGHLAHQTNLSIKATLGIGSYARLARMLNKPEAAEYERIAKSFADRWVKEADDGDHFRLAFDQPGSWSQKYNLVWDKILDLDLYGEAVRRKEMAFYRKVKNSFGIALDSRQNATPTKLDWSVWTATLTGDKADFDDILSGVWRFMNEVPQRNPLSDWYNSKTGEQIGFIARPVVGGVFVKALYDKALWNKWAKRDAERSANWAPLPKRPVVQQVVPTSEAEAATWRFTTTKPTDDWYTESFPDASWGTGKGGFGGNVPGASPWSTPDIWVRRVFDFSGPTEGLYLRIFHDEDAEVYLNGKKIAQMEGYSTAYVDVPMDATMKAALKQGRNVLAIHVRQTGGGQGVDAGFVRLIRP
ncbi:DUF4965 domain-containing protein [bacterium]|nr:MAG: DUF4965 domain-containing protein [bacterium]